WACSLRFGSHSAWGAVYALVPGAKGVRVIPRVQILLEWPVAAVATAAVDRLRRRNGGMRPFAFGAVLLLALALPEQLTRSGPMVAWRDTEAGWLRQFAPPPAGCRSFVATGGRAADPVFGPKLTGLLGHDTAAMLVAETLRVPTLNGFATFVPAGWNLFSIDRADYRERAAGWVAAHHLDGVCGLDLGSGRWDARPFGSAGAAAGPRP
ncbi:MAG: hypothetical protein INR65_10950, partial [Gluconacetobacter diazotrophicus]|nr:hypothetical protein [Gluconacetobacter diazotrophicus]